MLAQPVRLFLKFCALTGAAGILALWHHGHIRDFMFAVYDALPRRLPKRLRTHDWRVGPSMLQVYFGSPTVHYELSVHRKARCLEVGLHFEGERDENYRWAKRLAARSLEVQAKLGPEVEMEEWTRRWTRLHESRPIGGEEWRPSQDLTAELVEEMADRLARFIEVLEPILAEERAGTTA